MPLVFKKGKGTSVNTDSTVQKASITNDSAARKFVAPKIDSPTVTEDVTNSTSIIDSVSSLAAMSTAISSIAAQARNDLQSTRKNIDAVKTNGTFDERNPILSLTDAEVKNSADIKAQELSDLIKDKVKSLDMKSLSYDVHNVVKDSVFSTNVDYGQLETFNPATPSLDSVTVDMNKNAGTIDCFFTTLKFSLPIIHVWNKKTKAIRIFRAVVTDAVSQRGIPILTLRGMEKLSTLKLRSRSKNFDQLSAMEQRMRELGLENTLSLVNKVDGLTGLRQSSTVDSVNSSQQASPSQILNPNQNSSADVSSFIDEQKYSNLDKSVANDLNSLKNIKNQDPNSAVINVQSDVRLSTSVPTQKGLLNGAIDLGLSSSNSSQIVTSLTNVFDFKEIACISLDKLKSQAVGNTVQYSFIDESVSFGRQYKYYILSVDSNMFESTRSQFADVFIDGTRIPERPKKVFAYNTAIGASLNILVDDQLVEKFEVFRKDLTRPLDIKLSARSTIVSDINGFNINSQTNTAGANGFLKVGECINSSKETGATLTDRGVIPGRKYSYRIYSVDVFNNKSESPFEVDLFVPERSSRNNDLLKPTITAEVDSTTGKMKLTFSCKDKRVSRLFLAKRNLTLNQSAFTTPAQVNALKFGKANGGEGQNRFEDVILRGENKDLAWTGMFENTFSDMTFIDKTAALDNIYQYRIYGVDKFGNQTPFDFSKQVLVLNRAMINEPTNVIADVIQGPKFTVGGIRLSWQESNVSNTSEEMLGSQNSLADNAVKMLYQVERKKVGEERWYEFPLIDSTTFFDATQSTIASKKVSSTKGLTNPTMLPPLIEENQTYVYRVKALQKGTFVSNYSAQVQVYASLPLTSPVNFRIKASDAKVRPNFVVLNWETSNSSAVVDKWEIERAEVNNFFAARLNVKNPSEFSKLQFKQFRTVFRESSRFRSELSNNSKMAKVRMPGNNSITSPLQTSKTLFTGDQQFQDSSVIIGNTYFYRIRAIGLNGATSNWVYRGIKVVSEDVQKVIESLVDPDMKNNLTSDPTPIKVTASNDKKSSMSLQPGFAEKKNTGIVNIKTK